LLPGPGTKKEVEEDEGDTGLSKIPQQFLCRLQKKRRSALNFAGRDLFRNGSPK
jgi:hypothetical protein